MKKLLSFALASLMLLPTFAACGGKTESDTAETGGEITETETEKPKIDLKGRALTFMSTVPSNQTKHDQNRYIEGVGKMTGEIIDDTVFERNSKIAEELNVKLLYDVTDYHYENLDTAVTQLIVAGDSTHDMYIGAQNALSRLGSKGYFKDANKLEGVDYTAPWWNKAYMDEVAPGRGGIYFMAGDYFIDILMSVHVLYLNKSIYENAIGKTDDLYKLVLDGKWTLDKFKETAIAGYVDVNNDGKTDKEDKLGFVSNYLYATVDPFAYGTDQRFTTRNADGDVQINLKTERAVLLAEKLTPFFAQKGTLILTDGTHKQTFIDGKSLFLGYFQLVDAGDFRDMTDDYGFLPHPKLDENQDTYYSLVHDTANVGAIPVTAKNTDILGYVLEELCKETSTGVLPAWYETSLKIKYSRDDVSAQMIDLIHDTMATSFLYVYSSSLNGIGMVYRDLANAHNTEYISRVETLLPSATQMLNDIIAAYKENLK